MRLSHMTYIGYITGPRAEQPVGVRVVEPPPNTRQQQRGNLYIVIELAGDHPDRAAITDRLLSEVQRAYYTFKGSQSQVMVDAVQAAQRLLREINAHTPQYPLGAGILCAALMTNRLLIASSGPAFALVRASERVHMFPAELEGTMRAPGEAVEIYRQDVQDDDTFFLGGGSWLKRVPVRTLVSVVFYTNADNCSDAADELYEQAGLTPLPGLLVVVGGSSGPSRSGGGYPGGTVPRTPPPAPGGGQGQRRPRFGGLPTSLSAAPPARMPPPSPPPSAPTPPSASKSTQSVDAPPAAQPVEPPRDDVLPSEGDAPAANTPAESFAPHQEPFATMEPPAPARNLLEDEPETVEAETDAAMRAYRTEAAAVPHDAARMPVEEIGGPTRPAFVPQEPDAGFDPLFPSQEEAAPTGPSWTERLSEQTGRGWQKMRSLFSDMLPERTTSEPSAAYRRSNRELEGADIATLDDERADEDLFVTSHRTAAVQGASTREPPSAEDVAPVWDDAPEEHDDAPVMPSPVLDMSPFAPPRPTQGARARLFIMVALAILVLVPAVVLGLRWGQGATRSAEAEQLTGEAELTLMGAQSALDEGDKVTARNRLMDARALLTEAIELDGMNEHRSQLIGTIASEMQEVLQIKPLYGLTSPLITFADDARPTRVLVINEDIFVIDGGKQQLLAYRYDPSTGLVSDQAGQIVMQQGDLIDGVTVGALADMAWLPLVPGYEDRPSLIVIDRNNNVFRYDPRVEGASLLDLAGRAEWGSLGQIQTFGGRIYLADDTRGSILRYSPGPGPGQYAIPPDPWFAPQTQVNLTGLISMEIDGDIWLLFNSGVILRYRNGEQVPFSPENSIGLAEEPVDMYVMRQENNLIYLVDAAEDRILVYDKSGAYLSQLQSPEEGLLRGLAGLYVDEVSGVMYLLTQNGLFSHPVIQ